MLITFNICIHNYNSDMCTLGASPSSWWRSLRGSLLVCYSGRANNMHQRLHNQQQMHALLAHMFALPSSAVHFHRTDTHCLHMRVSDKQSAQEHGAHKYSMQSCPYHRSCC